MFGKYSDLYCASEWGIVVLECKESFGMQKKYEVVIAWIRRELSEGRLKPGDRIPSENMLKGRRLCK